jgi:hypothetical protein
MSSNSFLDVGQIHPPGPSTAARSMTLTDTDSTMQRPPALIDTLSTLTQGLELLDSVDRAEAAGHLETALALYDSFDWHGMQAAASALRHLAEAAEDRLHREAQRVNHPDPDCPDCGGTGTAHACDLEPRQECGREWEYTDCDGNVGCPCVGAPPAVSTFPAVPPGLPQLNDRPHLPRARPAGDRTRSLERPAAAGGAGVAHLASAAQVTAPQCPDTPTTHRRTGRPAFPGPAPGRCHSTVGGGPARRGLVDEARARSTPSSQISLVPTGDVLLPGFAPSPFIYDLW